MNMQNSPWKPTRMAVQSLKPRELVIEFRPWLRISIRQVKTRNENATDRGFDVTGLHILQIARESGAGDDRLAATG